MYLKSILRGSLPVAVALAFGASAASAQLMTIDINNHSFESPGLDDGDWDGGADDWSGENFGIENPTDSMFDGTSDNGPIPSPGDGIQVSWINSGGNIFQHVGPLEPNLEYTLTVALGNRLDRSVPGDDTLELELELYNGTDRSGDLLNSVVTTPPPDLGDFADYSVSFLTGPDASGELTIGVNNPTGGQGIIDNVRLTAVPEPSTYAAILGGLFLAFAIWRRRR